LWNESIGYRPSGIPEAAIAAKRQTKRFVMILVANDLGSNGRRGQPGKHSEAARLITAIFSSKKFHRD